MKIKFNTYFTFKILLKSVICIICFSCFLPKIAKSQPANVVGYSTKVFAHGTEKIKVKNPKSELAIFENKGIALMLPDGWKEIAPGGGNYYFEGAIYKINLANDPGDQAWVWRGDVELGYYIDVKTIADELTNFAPINEHIKTVIIDGSGPKTQFYIWKASHIEEGKKKDFKVFAAIKPAPVFKPGIGNARLFGKSAGPDPDGEAEAAFLEMAKFLQTYDGYTGKGKKKKSKSSKTFEQKQDEATAAIIEKALSNFSFTYNTPDEEEKPAEHNGKKMTWNFQTYPGWAQDKKKVSEDPVTWMVPSITWGSSRITESVPLSPQHQLLIYTNGLSMVNLQDGKLEWYKQSGYRNYNIATGNKDEFILFKKEIISTKIQALETLSGKEIWSTSLNGDLPRNWLVNEKAKILVAVQSDKKETIISGIDISSGDIRWSKSINRNAGLKTAPIPEMAGDYIITYSNGISAISSTTGEQIWVQSGIKFEDKSPLPKIKGDTIVVIDKDNILSCVDVSSGSSLGTIKLNQNAEYTNISLILDRIYLRSRFEKKDETTSYSIEAIGLNDIEHQWSYSDTVMTTSNIIDDKERVYVSTWQGPLALDRSSGSLLFRTTLSEVGKTYPITIRQYGDTIVYSGEMVIAGVDRSTGDVLYRHAFDPVSQRKNLDAIDPNIEALYKFLKFWGKAGLNEEEISTGGNPNYFFSLSRASQERSSQLSKLSSSNRMMYSSTGQESYYYKSKIQHNQSLIENSMARAFANAAMLEIGFNSMVKQVRDMTEPERQRYYKLSSIRANIVAIYETYDAGDYAFRKTEKGTGSKITIIHLPTGRIINQIENERSLGDVIINPDRGEFYYHELRMVPELKQVSLKEGEGTVAHAYYLVSLPLD